MDVELLIYRYYTDIAWRVVPMVAHVINRVTGMGLRAANLALGNVARRMPLIMASRLEMSVHVIETFVTWFWGECDWRQIWTTHVMVAGVVHFVRKFEKHAVDGHTVYSLTSR
jgi:hypothetical protein